MGLQDDSADKILVTNFDHLSLNPGIYMVVEKNQLLEVGLWSTHTHNGK